MKNLDITKENGIYTVRIQRPKANAINHAMVKELVTELKGLASNAELKALILTGSSPFFSAGLDVIELYSYDKSQMATFWSDFKTLTHTLYTFPKPVIAAISGHSPAGGCILALCADYRLMQEGKFKIGLNEVAVSIVVPKPVHYLYSSVIGEARAEKALLQGKMFLPQEAKAIELIDEIVPEDQLELSANQLAQNILQLPHEVWIESKKAIRSKLAEILLDEDGTGFAATESNWWSESSRYILGKMVASLTAPKQ